ncbi:MAG: hypothetical protein JST16_18955 [Bdellovibrionales bacterium]|nr:hypothetical protein [Bdellovibrionales bacterium]
MEQKFSLSSRLLLTTGFLLIAQAMASGARAPQPIPTVPEQPTVNAPIPDTTVPVNDSTAIVESNGESTSATPTPPQVIRGWLADYDDHIELTVTKSYPKLLALSDSRMAKICPNWNKIAPSSRPNFWSALLWSIAGPESARERTAIYLEDTMGTDSVTGYQVRSEGLLQLSYQDMKNYKYTGGDISWEQDKAKAIADYNSRTAHGNPDRTILNAYSNLNLGLFIMNRLLLTSYPSSTLDVALGKYWSSMQASRSTFNTKVLPNMKTRMPACFR